MFLLVDRKFFILRDVIYQLILPCQIHWLAIIHFHSAILGLTFSPQFFSFSIEHIINVKCRILIDENIFRDFFFSIWNKYIQVFLQIEIITIDVKSSSVKRSSTFQTHFTSYVVIHVSLLLRRNSFNRNKRIKISLLLMHIHKHTTQWEEHIRCQYGGRKTGRKYCYRKQLNTFISYLLCGTCMSSGLKRDIKICIVLN